MSVLLERWRARLPGAALCAVIALAATFVASAHGGPQFLYALLLGMALHPFSADARAAAGIDFCMKALLRVGVALLGARIAADQVIELGGQTAAMVVLAVASTIAIGVWLARLLRLPASFGVLSGGATAICGASAALAISAVLPEAPTMTDRRCWWWWVSQRCRRSPCCSTRCWVRRSA